MAMAAVGWRHRPWLPEVGGVVQARVAHYCNIPTFLISFFCTNSYTYDGLVTSQEESHTPHQPAKTPRPMVAEPPSSPAMWS